MPLFNLAEHIKVTNGQKHKFNCGAQNMCNESDDVDEDNFGCTPSIATLSGACYSSLNASALNSHTSANFSDDFLTSRATLSIDS